MGIRASQADIDRLTNLGATVGPAASLPGPPACERATVGAITLCLPWPPSVNNLRVPIVRRKRVRMVTSARGRAYQKEVAAVVALAGYCRIEGRLAVEIEANPPDRRVRDLDNALKAVIDSIMHAGVFADDGQIDEIVIRRGAVIKGGMVKVRVRSKGH